MLCFIFLILSNYLPSVISSADGNQSNVECTPLISTCGSQRKITYPFWDSRVPSYCGYPGFKLTCKANSSLTITIRNQDYNILAIDYDSKTLTISKPQFSDSPCPKYKSLWTNTTLDFNLLDFTSNTQNATLFYDCNPTDNFIAPYSFPCSFDNSTNLQSSNIASGYLEINKTWEDKLREHCSFQIQIPILRTAAQELVTGVTITNNVLSQGFEVKWKIDQNGQCQECMNSGGRCGYNQTIKEPTCFCQDGAHTRSCDLASNNTLGPQTTSKKSSKGTIIIAMGIGVGVCLVSSMLCFFLYRRYRKKDSSAQFQTQNKSYSTSTGGSTFPILNGSTYFGVNVFNYRELEEATDYFSPSKELGEGGFGTVYHGKLQDGREVAIKRLYENNSRRAEQFLNEVELLADIRHKNLVNLYGCTARQSRELLLVYEYVPNGTVADHLRRKERELGLLPWSTRLTIATETASALVYLHVCDIVHRDVKTQNILLDNEYSVKVADFGLSRLFPLDVTHVSTAPQGTPGYVDPEYRQCYQLTEKSDVYSFGVVLAELISSLPAVDVTRKRNEINLSNMAINKFEDGALHEFVDPSLGFESDFLVKKEITAVAELMFQCLQSTKDRRPQMNDVLKRLLAIQHQQGSEVDSAEIFDIPADDVLMLKGDFSPASPPMEDYLEIRHCKPNASV